LEYWSLTPAETYQKVQGYIYNRDVMASNFRALFWLGYNQNVKKGDQKSDKQLWPLPSIDGIMKKSTEDIYERNKRIIKAHEDKQ
jgi:hypothetical protein